MASLYTVQIYPTREYRAKLADHLLDEYGAVAVYKIMREHYTLNGNAPVEAMTEGFQRFCLERSDLSHKREDYQVGVCY